MRCEVCGNEVDCPSCALGDQDKRFAGVTLGDEGNVVLRIAAEPEERHRIVIERTA